METNDTTGNAPTNEMEQEAARLAKNQARRKRRTQERGGQGGGSGAGKDTPPPITESAALGLPENVPVTGTDLRLWLKAPSVRESAKTYEAVLNAFPAPLLYAALSDPAGKGVDIDVAVEYSEKVREQQVNEGQDDLNDLLTPVEAESNLRVFGLGLIQYVQSGDAKPPNAPFEKILEVTWKLAEGHNDDLTREKLADALLDNLSATQFADLLRCIMRCLSGSDTPYPDDPAARFFPS